MKFNRIRILSRPVKVVCVTTVDLSLRFLLMDELLHLRSLGYEVHGVCAPGPHIAAVEQTGIPVHTIPMFRQIKPGADVQALYRLVRHFWQMRYTIVHTHTPKAGLLGRLAARLAGVPFVFHTNHGLLNTATVPCFTRTAFLVGEYLGTILSDRIFSVNTDDIEWMIKNNFASPAKLQLLSAAGLGINLTQYDPQRYSAEARRQLRQRLNISPTAIVLLIVGRMVREKGYAELFQVLPAVFHLCPDLVLVVAGEPDSEKPDALTPELLISPEIAKRVFFLGWQDTMPDVYALADLVVFPSHREGMPLTAMETAAMSLPIVATNIRGTRSLVVHNQTGFLVALGKLDELQSALIKLATDSEVRLRLGKAARAFAVQHCNRQVALNTLTQVYRSFAPNSDDVEAAL